MIENPKIYNVFAKYLKLKYLKKYIGKDKKEYICLTEKGKNCANIIWQELVQCDIIQENNFKLTAKKVNNLFNKF